jgi:hypothetical protein
LVALISVSSWRVDADLLFDAGELHQLFGELVRVHRLERVLVLDLRGEDGEEGVEVVSTALACASRRWQ